MRNCFFSIHLKAAICHWCSSHIKNSVVGTIPTGNTMLIGRQGARHSCLSHFVSCHEIQVFLHFVWSEYFSEWMFLHFKMLSVHKHSFHMLTLFSQGNNVLVPPASNLDICPKEIECFLHSLERGYLAQSWCSSPMKTLRGRQYSIKQLTQFTVLGKVLDRLASNINDSLTRDTVLLPFTWYCLFCTKMAFLTL
jgi:hypothetical protein